MFPLPTCNIDDRRYEKHVPLLLGELVFRSSTTWEWRDARVHIERVGDPDSPIRILLIHGAGGNSSAMWPYAAHLSKLGAYVTAPDLPGYGKTVMPHPERIRYNDWQQFVIDLVREEDEDRPLIIMGASMGGMLAYDAAASTGLASRLIVTCLLDPRDPAVRKRLTWHPLLASVAGPAMKLLDGPFSDLRMPIRWIADMRHIANQRGLVKEVISDRAGGGSLVPLGWMRSFLEASPVIEPEQFTGTPVTMLHPGDDRWTPLEISQPFYSRISAEKRTVILENCGHFPVEPLGFAQMIEAVREEVEGALADHRGMIGRESG